MAKQTKQKETKKQGSSVEPAGSTGFAFGKENYRLLFIGLALILVGFLLMIGGGSDDPNVFSDKIFNFRRLTLAPILILAGYVIEILAIMKKPKD
ncbi:MAG TPA: DUF3098 domain-containing protein [Bacteroidales bacterium]|nr:DUF3098 domain-containing protein [Bacteroidales bacterium]HPE55970.1 DUF3098 domain-containing protein [Bacteroidales bacterium]HRX96132.1 DUF3098 domain-containing protein [Bacteroidales bacterium]